VIEGGLIERNCKVCKRNQTQAEYNCGYIPKEQHYGNPIYLPALKNPDFTLEYCPVWYYNEYQYYYKIYNYYKDEKLNRLDFKIRLIVSIFKEYISLRREYEMKKQMSKKEKSNG